VTDATKAYDRHVIASIAGATGNVRVKGIVLAAGEGCLTSPITKRPCVCFEVHGGLARSGSHQQGAQDFLVKDASGTALIVMDRFELALGSLERGEQMSVLEADISKVSLRLSDLKAKARTVRHAERRQVDGELRELKGLATLLCAIRAHARGNVHIGKTMEGQERYIQEGSKQYEKHGELNVAPARYLRAFDTILSEGDAVEVTGNATQEPDPERAAGYRDRALRTVIRAPEGGVVCVSGEGAELAARALAPQVDLAALARASQPEATSNKSMWLWGVALFALVVIAKYLEFC
jgi:hypothetical protein